MAAHLCEEKLHRIHFTGLGGVVQGRVRLPRVSFANRSVPATHVFRLRVDVCACGDEQGHHVHVAALRCQVERRVGLWAGECPLEGGSERRTEVSTAFGFALASRRSFTRSVLPL